MRAFQWIRMLASLPGRLAGSASERAAAARVRDWLEELGFEDVAQTPVPARPHPGRVLALHLALGALGAALGGGVGLGLAWLAAESWRRETAGGARWLSRALRAPTSVDAVARAGARRPAQRVVLSADLDVASAGWIFREPPAGFLLAPGRRRSGIAGPSRALLLAAVALALASWLGATGFVLASARVLVVGGLLAGVLLGLQWALAPPSPGANGASAVAAMLTAAEQLLARLPEDAELWVVATGAAQVGGCGMQAFCDAHDAWPRDSSYFIDFASVGGGALHFAHGSGRLDAADPRLFELARRLAASGLFGDVTACRGLAGSDAGVPAERGFAALSLLALEPDGLPRNHHRIEDLPEALDPEIVIRAADFGAALARAALGGEAGPIAIV